MTSPIRSLALASALLAVLAACSKPEQPQMPPPEVVVMTATPKDVPLQRDLVGRLSPYRSSDVRARVAGVVQKRVYQEGSDVKEGQVLFQIDPAPLQAALSASQAVGVRDVRCSSLSRPNRYPAVWEFCTCSSPAGGPL